MTLRWKNGAQEQDKKMMFSVKRTDVVGIVVASAFSPFTAHAATITGTVVTEGANSKPVPGATVFIQQYDGTKIVEVSPATTDDKGVFTLTTADNAYTEAKRKEFGVSLIAYAPGYGLVKQGFKPEEPIRLALSPEKVLHGTVKDPAGKPVANAVVSLSYAQIGNKPTDYISLFGGLTKRFAVKSNAAGEWEIHNMPAKTQRASVNLNDPRFVQLVVFSLEEGLDKKLAVLAMPAGTITGRVVDKAGQPVAKVMINAQKINRTNTPGFYELGNQAETDARGEFKITQLGAGAFVVTTNTVTHDLVSVGVTGISVTSGEITPLTSPITMTPGAVIKGSVVSKTTGKPVEGVTIWTSGPHAPNNNGGWSTQGTTGVDGTYSVRVAPGDSAVHIGSQNPGFIYFDPAFPVTTQEGDTKTIAPFQLPESIHVTLQVADESGKAIGGLPLRIYHPGWQDGRRDEEYAKTDDTGRWDSSKDERDTLSLDEKEQWEIRVPNGYEVVSPKELKLSTAGPIPVVLKKVDLSNRSGGRVVSSDGAPLTEVNIHVSSFLKDSNGDQNDYQSQNLSADNQGRFVLPLLRPNSTVTISVSKWNYRRTHSGIPEPTLTVPADGTQPKLGDWVLTPLTGSVTGKLLNTAGKPVPGAWVWSYDGDNRTVTLTNAQGAFKLEHLSPDGPVEMQFAGGRAVGTYTTTQHTNAVLRLPAGAKPTTTVPVTVARRQHALRLIQEMASQNAPGEGGRAGNNGQDALADIVAKYDIPQALSLIQQKDGEIKESHLGGVLISATATDPERAKPLFLETHKKWRDPYMIFFRNFDMAMQFSAKNPAFAIECYETAKAQIGNGIAEDNFWTLLHATKMAYRLGAPDAEQWWDRAVKVGTAQYGGDTDSARVSVIDYAAQGNGLPAAKRIAELPPDKRERPAIQIIRSMADTQPLEALHLLKGWITDGTIKPSNNHEGGGSYPEAFVHLAKALAPLDAKEAAWVADKAPDYLRWQAQAWAASAIPDPQTRLTQYRSVMTDDRSWEKARRYAGVIEAAQTTKDTAFINEVRAALQASIASDMSVFDGNACENAARLTFLLSDQMPGTCRLLLEMSIHQARENNPASANDLWIIRPALAAMAWVDLPRALELANSLQNPKSIAQGKQEIIRTLLTPPSAWQTIMDNQ